MLSNFWFWIKLWFKLWRGKSGEVRSRSGLSARVRQR